MRHEGWGGSTPKVTGWACGASILAALLLASCATFGQTDVVRTATLARAAHANLCEGVEIAAKSAVIISPKLRTAIDLCVRADVVLDSADAAIQVGRSSDAVAQIGKAQSMLKTLREIL